MATRQKGEGSIYKRRDGTYEGKLSLGSVVRDGKTVRIRKSVYGATIQEVTAALQRARLESGLGYTEGSSMTVSAYLDRWLKDTIEPRRKYKTHLSYKDTIENHLKPVLGPTRLSDLKPPHLKSLRRLIRQHTWVDKNGAKRQATEHTAWYACGVLKNAVRCAVEDGLLAVYPFGGMRMERPPKRKMTPWTIDDARKFFAANEDDRLYAFWVLAVATGMREGEMIALRWDHVDLKNRTIFVEFNLEEHKKGAYLLAPVKTEASEATISIPEDAATALMRHRLREGVISDFVFTTKNKRPYFRSRINAAFKAAVAKARVPKIRVHDLRHTCATVLLEAGEDLKNIQALLRHSDFAVTANTYAHVTAKSRERTAGRMQSLLRGDE